MAVILSPDGRRVPVADAATYSGRHVNTIRRLVKTGSLTEYRVGPAVYVDLDELDRLIADDDPALRVADAIRRVVDNAPPLTEGQQRRLADLLRGDAK